MSTLGTVARTEVRLLVREWPAMVFAFAFPVLLMLVLAGVFGTEASAEYGGVTPSEYYVADYVAVPLGALALVGLPVVIASYREHGVLRRFEAAGVPALVVVGAQALVTILLVLLASGVVLAVAAPAYGVPAVQRPAAVVAGFLLGILTMTAVGVALGLVASSARSAQALGLLAFFPMWMLGAGGPPRPVMPDLMAGIAELLPLGHVASAIREPWLGTGASAGNLLALVVWLVAGVAAVALLARRAAQRGT